MGNKAFDNKEYHKTDYLVQKYFSFRDLSHAVGEDTFVAITYVILERSCA